MSSIPTINIDQETAQHVDNKWDDGNLATGGFVSTQSPDTYTINPKDKNYDQFKTKFTDCMLDVNFKGDLTPGTNNFKYKQFAEAISQFSTISTPIAPSSSTANSTSASVSQSEPAPSKPKIVIPKDAFEPETIIGIRPKAHTIPKSALNDYGRNFAKKDYSLVHYLKLVYARAQKNHPETSNQIQVGDLNIPGAGAQQHMQNIVAYFSTSPAEALLDEAEGSAP